MFVPQILHPTQLLKSDSSCDRKPRLKTDPVPSLFTRSKRDNPRTTGRHGNSSCSTIVYLYGSSSCLACYDYERIIFLCRPVVLGLSGLLRVNSAGPESVLSRGFPVTRTVWNCRFLETPREVWPRVTTTRIV